MYMKKSVTVPVLSVVGVIFGVYLFFVSTYFLFEIDAIETPRGWWNLLTFQCYSGPAGNDWCDPDSPGHRAP